MSFRLRIVLMTTALVLVLFSIGGVVLIHTTFEASVEKEEQSAVEKNEMLLKTIQLVEEHGAWFTEFDLISVINKICEENTNGSYLLEYAVDNSYVKNLEIAEQFNEISGVERNKVTISYFQSDSGENYLQTSTLFYLNGTKYSLNMGRNLSNVYQMRDDQINIFQKTFISLLVIGAVLSWVLAGLLTKPLRKLSKASAEIGAGNLSYRTKIDSGDEVGVLSQEFDKMAGELETHITLLKEAAEQQEMFIGAFTHEMKTPMTSIVGYADLLRTQNLSEDDREDALDYIFSEAKRLENLSLKLLELFVADKKMLVLKECSPSELVYHAANHLQDIYKKTDIKLEITAEEGNCLLEPDLFQSLLINLLDNAKKAMDNGGTIHISVKMTDKGCELSVTDTGKGIPKESLKHLTEAFYRVDKSRARSVGSAGLGLALCEKIVQLHHGTIQFESAEDVGTTVIAYLNGGQYEKK